MVSGSMLQIEIGSCNPVGTVHAESAFILEYSKDWVKGSRIPDVMVYAGRRLAEYKERNPNWKKMPYVLVPDIAIEERFL